MQEILDVLIVTALRIWKIFRWMIIGRVAFFVGVLIVSISGAIYTIQSLIRSAFEAIETHIDMAYSYLSSIPVGESTALCWVSAFGVFDAVDRMAKSVAVSFSFVVGFAIIVIGYRMATYSFRQLLGGK